MALKPLNISDTPCKYPYNIVDYRHFWIRNSDNPRNSPYYGARTIDSGLRVSVESHNLSIGSILKIGFYQKLN